MILYILSAASCGLAGGQYTVLILLPSLWQMTHNQLYNITFVSLRLCCFFFLVF